MAGPAAGQTWTQQQFLDYMSTPENWNFFVSYVLPDVMAGRTKIVGGDNKTIAAPAEVMAAVQDTGNQLGGLAIPAQIQDAIDHPTPAAPVSTAPPPPQMTASLQDELNGWGLGGLLDTARQHKAAGESDAQVVAWLRTTPEYAARFPGMKIRQDKNLAPISEAEYISLERSYAQTARQLGLLPGSYDATQAIGNDVSATEFSDRGNEAATAVYQEPPQTRLMLQTYYGLSPGQLASYYLNPDNAVPKLQRMLAAGQIGGVGMQLGFDVNRDLAEQLTQAGITAQGARTGFAKVAAEAPLFDESITERNDITKQQGIQAEFGLDAAAQKAIQDRQQKRAAIGQAGTGSVVTQKGVLGAGVAQ